MSSTLGGGNIVALVDDDLHIRKQLVAQLRANQLIVIEFDSVAQARNYLLQNSVQVVVSDLRLPHLNGLELLNFVRQLDAPPAFILMSGLGDVADVAEALRLGASDYLVKPIPDLNVVVHAIERALNVRALQAENEAYKKRLEAMNRELKDHVQLLERDQQAAKQVQSNLLPMTPVVYSGIELSHMVLPSLYLSGDFVDYGHILKRYVAFYLTDVSGHGASSAFVTVWLKQLVRRLFRERQIVRTHEDIDTAPDELLRVVNAELMQSRFFSHLTCVVGFIDTQTLEMHYVLAGHLPLPILISREGDAKFLAGKGKPVGLFEGASWTVYKEVLPKGFQLAVFSDGILERLPGGDLIEKEQYLLDAVKGSKTPLTLPVLTRLLALDCDGESPDDIAMILVKQLL
ncbi:MAG: SpoIIE family protein phosphatase [Marinagarivorans sp.]|nr:SpoIIE family protein phosphatase [Marinagarivorans sp.]